jgi:hypothetical protein
MRSFTALLILTAVCAVPAVAQQADSRMSFFITSVGSGDGANLGGLAGADAHCQALAEASGVSGKVWHAYLSAMASGGTAAVHARDRIGTGPWYNSRGVMIARDVAHLHSAENNLTKETQLNEKGQVVNGRGDSPNMHDLITGSNLDGTAYTMTGTAYTTPDSVAVAYDNCRNFTSNGAGSTRLGHHDRQGGGENPTSWNSAHGSRGCSQANLQATGGNGFHYCFAVGMRPEE